MVVKTTASVLIINQKGERKMKMKWTKQKAEENIKKCKEKGLKYWSAKDYLKNHKTMTSII